MIRAGLRCIVVGRCDRRPRRRISGIQGVDCHIDVEIAVVAGSGKIRVCRHHDRGVVQRAIKAEVALVVTAFVVVKLVLLVRNRLEIGNFCFLPKGHLGGGKEELLTLLLTRRRKRRLRVNDDGKNEVLPLVVKVVDVIIIVILYLFLFLDRAI